MTLLEFGSNLCNSEKPSFLFFDFSTAPPLLFYSYIPIIIISILISVFIFKKDNKSLQSRLLLITTSMFALWVLNILIQWVASYHEVLMYSWQMTALIEVAFYISAIYFTYVFVNKKDIGYWYKVLFVAIETIVAILTPTIVNISSYDINNCEGINGLLWNAIYIFEPIAIVTVIVLATAKYRQLNTNKNEKKQVLLFGLGYFIFLTVFFLSNFAGELTRIYEFNLWGPLGMVIFLIFLFYIIIRYETFNLKLFSAQIFVTAAIIAVASLIFVDNLDLLHSLIIITSIILVVMGVLLIRGVKNEIRSREKIQLLAKDLQSANSRLLELDKQKSEFVSFATHQLRAPLTAMKGYASLLMEGELGKLTKESLDAVNRIFESSVTLANVVDDYLNVSRIELGSMKYTFSKIDFKLLVENVLAELKPSIDKTGLNFSFSAPKTDPNSDYLVNADRDKLKQVITNLIDNSIKYTPKGSINTTLEKVGEIIRFSIKDTGVGIHPQVLPKLFSKFTRAENADAINIHGTGLGLFIAKDVITAHHGKIWAESVGENMGSKFVVELKAITGNNEIK